MNPSPEDLTSLEDRNLELGHTIVHPWYAELNPNDKASQDSVSILLRENSLIKVKQYLDDLAKAFEKLPITMNATLCNRGWSYFTDVKSNDPHALIMFWPIHDTLNGELVRLVFFHKYLKWAVTEHLISEAIIHTQARAAGEEILNPRPLELEMPLAHPDIRLLFPGKLPSAPAGGYPLVTAGIHGYPPSKLAARQPAGRVSFQLARYMYLVDRKGLRLSFQPLSMYLASLKETLLASGILWDTRIPARPSAPAGRYGLALAGIRQQIAGICNG
ncbi:hypothetical protein PGT21_023164 [Puccinia graminis f. sp. tritici]|uniref:Uncharacterized protein n=1 Tax=Puccinia graminis f. sp. tritici TaxID=56615 RepID=A0A5B0PBA6_PUCGR|nr:hypothetical protein PGT21_023164 [Puccinia graminis f. sp. tritici]